MKLSTSKGLLKLKGAIHLGPKGLSFLASWDKKNAQKMPQISLDLEKEVFQKTLIVKGEVPYWLSGTLIRNGPINVQINGKSNSHWFDGLAMLHAFSFQNGQVNYTNKFLRTNAYKKVFEEGSLHYDGFAVDPCRSLFKKVFTLFVSHKSYLHNANINVAQIAKQYVALTETPLPVRFDPDTLDTLGVLDYEDKLPKEKCWESAHPHSDQNFLWNYLIQYGKTSYYTFYKISPTLAKRNIVANIPVRKPAYMHSFAMTENYLILTEFPFVVEPLDLITKGKAFIKNFSWQPDLGTQFLVISRHTGEVVGRYKTRPFFAFHHVNAFEEVEKIYLDIVCYENADIIFKVADYFNPATKKDKENYYKEYPTHLERFCISLKTENLTSEILFKEFIEFPRINENFDGKPYSYGYFADTRDPYSENDIRPLYKFHTLTRQSWKWNEKGCYPGEPVFVHHPDAKEEDEGVILSVVLDEIHKSSFLLILNAKTFEEIGRATVTHSIPPGLHGQYYPQ